MWQLSQVLIPILKGIDRHLRDCLPGEELDKKIGHVHCPSAREQKVYFPKCRTIALMLFLDARDVLFFHKNDR